MKKLKRSQRLVDMTHFLLEKPHELLPLSLFADRYGSAKSSISEDLAIIKEVFEGEGMGELQTLAGAAGGVKFIPRMPADEASSFIAELCQMLEQSDRILPGGYLYMSDLLGQPAIMEKAGKLIATAFYGVEIDAVMTVETKGIPLAYATAGQLGLPVILVRRDHKVTEGSAVSINYVSGSHKSIHTMSLSRRALREKSKVLIVDDFMKMGGTIRGMVDLLGEFGAQVAGVGVLVESEVADVKDRLLHDYVSLVSLGEVDARERIISAHPGNYFAGRAQ
ncbi:pur operon repressor [Paenibacillus spiritus]|uniref:Pur operon repressor n=1 Tax=Paenibacillus spiritus TaxID=2496557 RepID=A0A5J5G8D4_9BACL|nr:MULTISPECIES: pur operon repressor [Paenibacillus]KAA9003590.1 pur operon repressor [Paenibacillus spiritus]